MHQSDYTVYSALWPSNNLQAVMQQPTGQHQHKATVDNPTAMNALVYKTNKHKSKQTRHFHHCAPLSKWDTGGLFFFLSKSKSLDRLGEKTIEKKVLMLSLTMVVIHLFRNLSIR